ncbi:MAG: hypothetical protein FD149_2679 [Rhodospirillaceae bacterium]|nr:MAG: hypothetical protein FD149_2679 [Rhodospirillaceae bacterium]
MKNDTGFVEGKTGLKVTYSFDEVDIFGGGEFRHTFLQDQDFTAPGQHYDHNEGLLSMGLNWFPDDRQIPGMEVQTVLGRRNISEWTAMLNYRHIF